MDEITVLYSSGKTTIKKAQVTLFIVIGVVILLVGMLLIAYGSEIKQYVTTILNPEITPVQSYVQECVKETATAALLLSASQGGHIDLPEQLEFGDPREPGFVPPPPSPVKVPLWWYKGRSYVPSKAEIQDQLSLFMEENLPGCLGDFSNFQQFTITAESDPISIFTIKDDIVRVDVEYPLLIKNINNQSEVEISRFKDQIDVQYGRLYDFAVDILEYENANNVLENLTLDMIAAADGEDDSPYIPYEGFDVRCGTGKEWSIQFDIIPELQQMVKYNMHFLTFNNAKRDYQDLFDSSYTLEICDNENDQGECTDSHEVTANTYDYYRSFYHFDVSDEDVKDIHVKTIYDPTFWMNLDVSPRDGDTVRGFPLQIPIVGTCIKIYHHRYDITYPLLMQLTDNDDFVFSFAFPVIIENNRPKRYSSPYVQSAFTYSSSNEEYCGNAQYNQVVIAKDNVTGEFLDNVTVEYDCVTFTCPIGTTGIPMFQGVPLHGSIPSIEATFPGCVNGFLVAHKPHYRQSVQQITIDKPDLNIPHIALTPLAPLGVTVYVIEGGVIRNIAKDELAVVNIRNNEDDFDESAYYPPVHERLESQKVLELIKDDTKYDLDIKLVKDDIPVGGYFLANWTVTGAQLSTATQVTFYVYKATPEPDSIKEFVPFWKSIIEEKEKKDRPLIS